MEEAAELQALIAAVADSGGAAAPQHYDRYKAILTKYQEQPQLLDGVLEAVVQPLAALLRRAALSSSGQQGDTCVVQAVCRLLHVLASVRGYKTVVRFFPHEAADLERVLQVLGCVTAEAKAAASSSGGGGTGGLWEAQAVLLLWLSILVLLPFDLVILDSSVTDAAGSGAAADRGYPPLAASIMALCQEFLSQPGAVREMAALLLARLLTRPDMPQALADFLAWQQAELARASGAAAVFLLPGVLQTLAQVYKLGRRQQLLQLTPAVWQQLAALLDQDAASGLATNALARKLAVKLAQRVGLAMLPPQLAGWRYVQAAADLGSNLAGTASAGATAVDATPAAAPAAESAGAGVQQEELCEVPAEIEEVLGVLLGSCSDRDTVVRWSAAKGAARLASCLPQELAAEVVQGVLGLLSPSEPDTSWHGGCLAIAELARRSILSPGLLQDVAWPLRAALAYDVRRGPHSVGAHVRDAAAYVCWAFARSYSPAQLAACMQSLAAGLLVVACYDREVNCRRAAAAAFQECVGRLGSFPHGLAVLGVADYFTVGNMASAYLRVAPFVAQFDEYRQALLEHLLRVKLSHWDKPVRALAAMGLAALAPVAATQLASQAVPQLLQRITNDVLEVRCGAVLGVAELLPALAAAQQQPSQHHHHHHHQQQLLQDSVSTGIVRVLQDLEAAACYRGKGGELMREMAARLAQQLATAAAGLQVVPLVGFSGGSSGSGNTARRHKAEQDLEQQQGSSQAEAGGSRVPSRASADGADDADDDDGASSDADEAAGAEQESGSQQQQRPRLVLPLTPEYHAAAVKLLLDCCSHAQGSIQAAGVAALQAHARAFQQSQHQQLVAVVDQLCSRLQGPDAPAAARRGAAAALGVLPAALIGEQACRVLVVLVSAVQEPLEPATGRDIETRIAAVTALAQLCQELIRTSQADAADSPPQQQQQQVQVQAACGLSVGFLRSSVVPVLLSGLCDYSRDNRGDVGSWVREAAMDGLTQLLLLLGSLQQGATAAAAPGAPAAGWSPCELQQLHGELAVQLVSGLLQQSLERIARLRETALISLQGILAQPASAAAAPGAAAIAAALPADAAELAGVASLAVVPRIAWLLQVPVYRPHVLEGLVASIGGVDASLSKAASAALLEQLGQQQPAAADAGQLQQDVAGLLLQLWQQEAGSARLSLPLIKTAALLITHTGLAGVVVSPAAPSSSHKAVCSSNGGGASLASTPSSPASFALGVLQLLKQELKGCGDVAKLLEGVALLAQLACVPDCSASAIQTVMLMLVNRYPKVRRAMAEQLYLQLLAVQSEAELGGEAPTAADGSSGSIFTSLPPDDLEAALDALLISAWDGQLEQVRVAREELAALLHVEVKTRRVARVLPAVKAADVGAVVDQEGGYQSLLDDAARGGGY